MSAEKAGGGGGERSLVGLVVVSHSAKIADGIVELAGQMAPDVSIVAAGGSSEGGIGTDFTRVMEAMVKADSGSGVVVLTDLGSAVMTAETAVDMIGDDAAARLRLVDAPIVEGSVAAAVAAQAGESVDDVAAASVGSGAGSPAVAAAVAGPGDREASQQIERYVRTVTLTNDDGLHARPAAQFVKLAATFPAKVTVGGKDAKSLLGIMSLGLAKGRSIEIVSGPEGREAVDALVALVESGFSA